MTRKMALYLTLVVGVIVFFTYMIHMPGNSYKGALPTLDDDGHEMARRFESHVTALCSNPAGRNFIEKQGLAAAKKYIAEQFKSSGYQVEYQEYQISGDTFANIEVTHLLVSEIGQQRAFRIYSFTSAFGQTRTPKDKVIIC